MKIEIKKSTKPVKYQDAINFLENRLIEINSGKNNELIWILEHEEVFTAGTSYKSEEVLNNEINLVKTNRGGKITYHGPGQLIIYFLLNLRQRLFHKMFSSFLLLCKNFIAFCHCNCPCSRDTYKS